MTTQRFPYVQVDPSLGVASALPYIPVTLTHGQQEIVASALVDSGATINVLPYHVGLQLGAVGEQQTVPVQLSGNLAASEARALLLTGQVGDFVQRAATIPSANLRPVGLRVARNSRNFANVCRSPWLGSTQSLLGY